MPQGNRSLLQLSLRSVSLPSILPPFHHITSKAPLFTLTCDPVSLIVPPLPLSISIPVPRILTFCPPALSRVIPPLPGVSSSKMLLPPSVLIIVFLLGGESKSVGI